jgi:hypothetical protein
MPQTPYEIIGNPCELYVAPLATAFPLLGVAPAGTWVKLGKLGARNQSNDGVKVIHNQKIELIRPEGATGPVKAFRTEEDLSFEVTLWDLTLEAYRYVLNGVAVVTVAPGTGIPGTRALPLGRGPDVAQFAFLLRGPSPYHATFELQYEVPVVVDVGNPTILFSKGKPAGLSLKWQALEDPSASGVNRYGTLRAQELAAI